MFKQSKNKREYDLDIEKIVRGLEQGYQKLLKTTKKQGRRLVVLRNGEITKIKI
jgi:hypothetical protein